MSEVVPNAVDPLVCDFFIVGALSAWAPLAPLCGSRFAPARDGFEPSELLADGADEADAWPYVLFGPSEDGIFDQFAQTSVLLSSPFLVRAFMREDIARLRGEDFEDATAKICAELQKALPDFGATEITGVGNTLRGTVHGCQLMPQLHRVTYGERGRRVSEIGVYIRLICN